MNMKILISAYACEPHKGSEPGVGWNWVKQIARFHEVWVITRANNKEKIEEELNRNPISNIHFVYYDLPKWMYFWKRGQRGLYFYYCFWQLGIFFLAKKLHKRHQFDIVHHLTFGNNWMPTFMPFLNIPFIWGPIGGAETVPKNFKSEFSFKWRYYETLRNFLQWWALKLDPIIKMALKRSTIIIARTKITQNVIPKKYKSKTVLILESGISMEDFSYKKMEPKKNNNFKILMVGRLIYWKGFSLAIKAFAKLVKEVSNSVFFIIGGGPEIKNLKKLSKRLAIEDKVQFLGQLPRTEVLKHMAEADVFLYPSLKDAGAWVLYEAMLVGLPVVCLDYAGPGEIVTKECGIKVKVETPEQVVNDLASALKRLALDNDLRYKLSQGAKKRAAYFAWDRKGEIIKNIYKNFLEKTN